MGKHLSEYTKDSGVKGHYTKDIKQKVEENSIVYAEPEEEFVDGHPLGNGDLGIMVTGSPTSFKFYYSKIDVWDNRTVRDGGSVFPGVNYDELIKIVENGDRDMYQQINKEEMKDYSSTHYPSPQSCGLLDIRFTEGSYKSYNQVLNIYKAEENINWKTGNGRYNLNCFISPDQNISEVHIDFFDMDKNTLEILLYRSPSDLYETETYLSDNKFLGFEFTFPDGLKYVNLLYIDSDDNFKIEGNRIKTSESISSNLRIIQSITTSYESENPKELAVKRMEAYLKENSSEHKEKNQKYWSNFWNRSYIDIYSKEVEKIWYMGLYLIGSTSKPGSPAMPGLQGVWLEDYNPAWKGDYTIDLNIEMNYWPVYTSNHLDLAEPFYRCYKNLIPKFRKDTKEYFQKEGIRVPISHDYNGNDLAGYLAGLFWQGSSAWIASHFWKNYLYSNDKEFLEKTAYPFLLESIKYYNSMLRKSGDKYIVYMSWTPEEMEADQIKAIDDNPTIDLSLIGYLYNAFISAVEILNINPDIDMTLVRDINTNLSDYPQKEGHITDSENCDFNYSHVHLSTMVTVYPTGEFNAYNISKENYELALNTFYKYVKRGHTSKRMYGGLTITWLSCVSAVLGLKDYANNYISDFLDSYANKKNYLNMTFDYGRTGRGVNIDDTQEFSAGTEYEFAEKIFEIETNTCAAEAINLMLLQSFNNGVSVFPAYPWRDGAFEGLRAEGGFLVSAKLKDWKIESIYIESLNGNRCTVFLDSTIKKISVKRTTDGKAVTISELKVNDISNKVFFNFETDINCEYEILAGY